VYTLRPEYGPAQFDKVANATQCPGNSTAFADRLACLRTKPWQAIYNASATAGAFFAPSLGGYVARYPSQLEKSGDLKNKIPLVVTNMRDEGTMQGFP
jgi:hypothetical protein